MAVCTTCYQPGIDGEHDCPGLGDIQVSRTLGRGLVVETAPQRARMDLAVLANHGHGLAMQSNDQINIGDQVLYQVIGYDPGTATLVLDLVHDWRPAAAVRALPEHELHDTIRKMARIDPPWFRSVAQTMDRIARGGNARAVLGDSVPAQGAADADEQDEEPVGPAKPGIPRCTATWAAPDGTARCWRRAVHNQRVGYETHMGETEQGYRWQWIDTEPGATPHRPESDDTACTPIPAATLMQLSEVPPELQTGHAGGRPETEERMGREVAGRIAVVDAACDEESS